jgi:hypothetical protein
MNKINKFFASTLIAGLAFGFSAQAQDVEPEKNTEKIHRPFHIGFIYPISTNGIEAYKTINNISLNAIGGVSGGVNGYEGSGTFNLTNGDVNGLQTAGGVNIVRGDINGVQMAGGMNFAAGETTYLQFAGGTNIAVGDVKAGQLSGGFNFAGGDAAFQSSGGFNFSGGTANVQLSGGVNIAREVTGAQIAGGVNIAKSVKGLQLGVVNIAEEVEGTSIGVVTIVKNGYRALEVEYSEYLQGTVQFKTGTKGFYNIFAVGARRGDDTYDHSWAFGYGFGSLIPVNKRIDANFDLMGYHINDTKEWWETAMNQLYKLKGNVAFKLNENVSLYGGPSLNVVVSDKDNGETELASTNYVPWKVFDYSTNNRNIKLFAGFNVGLRFNN